MTGIQDSYTAGTGQQNRQEYTPEKEKMEVKGLNKCKIGKNIGKNGLVRSQEVICRERGKIIILMGGGGGTYSKTALHNKS
jgi:hypothetical protein